MYIRSRVSTSSTSVTLKRDILYSERYLFKWYKSDCKFPLDSFNDMHLCGEVYLVNVVYIKYLAFSVLNDDNTAQNMNSMNRLLNDKLY